MNRYKTLRSLETLMESFLERVVTLKEKRLAVLEGINQLDDIARQYPDGADITDSIGDWFAQHNKWLTENNLKPADIRKITSILEEVRKELESSIKSSPAEEKILDEISRWNEKSEHLGHKLILKRGPERQREKLKPDIDTISLFNNDLSRLTNIFLDYSGSQKHILSVLDDLLKAAKLQTNKDTLILSAFIIYYLKQNGYKVEPYVKKLKEAEAVLTESRLNA